MKKIKLESLRFECIEGDYGISNLICIFSIDNEKVGCVMSQILGGGVVTSGPNDYRARGHTPLSSKFLSVSDQVSLSLTINPWHIALSSSPSQEFKDLKYWNMVGGYIK